MMTPGSVPVLDDDLHSYGGPVDAHTAVAHGVLLWDDDEHLEVMERLLLAQTLFAAERTAALV